MLVAHCVAPLKMCTTAQGEPRAPEHPSTMTSHASTVRTQGLEHLRIILYSTCQAKRARSTMPRRTAMAWASGQPSAALRWRSSTGPSSLKPQCGMLYCRLNPAASCAAVQSDAACNRSPFSSPVCHAFVFKVPFRFHNAPVMPHSYRCCSPLHYRPVVSASRLVCRLMP